MLSIEQCKKILNKDEEWLTDEQISEVRDFLIRLAEIQVENLKNERDDEKSGVNGTGELR